MPSPFSSPEVAPTPAKAGSASSWRIFSSISLPGLKVTTLLGGTSTRLPVRGFRALPRLAPLDFENAEISQLDSAFGKKRFHDGVKGLLNDFLGLELGQAGIVRNLFNDFFLGHGSGLPGDGI